ncbi:MAG: cytochrome c oxidase assembly protein [Proteobacteria bacterium]|nr:cytochrome c oxidase assembly protein [Pseudomonadota bacterium]
MSVAYGHTDSVVSVWSLDPQPDNPWRFPWLYDPTLLFFILLGIIYYFCYRQYRKQPVKLWQVVSFYLGTVINVVVLSPWVDDLADQLFFVHMIQHLAIILLGCPLIIAGAPFFIMVRSLPAWPRRHILWVLMKQPVLQSMHRFFSLPLVSLILFNFNFWFWHQPRWYNLALLNDFFHIIEHAMMAWTAIYLWRNIIDPHPLKSSLHMGFRVVFIASFMAVNIVLAAFLTYAKEPWYAYNYIAMPEWWADSWTRLDDQRLGGLVMWVPGGVILFIAMTICFFVWVQRENQKDAARLLSAVA